MLRNALLSFEGEKASLQANYVRLGIGISCGFCSAEGCEVRLGMCLFVAKVREQTCTSPYYFGLYGVGMLSRKGQYTALQSVFVDCECKGTDLYVSLLFWAVLCWHAVERRAVHSAKECVRELRM